MVYKIPYNRYNPIGGQKPTFTITDQKLYVPVVTLSTQDYVKLL